MIHLSLEQAEEFIEALVTAYEGAKREERPYETNRVGEDRWVSWPVSPEDSFDMADVRISRHGEKKPELTVCEDDSDDDTTESQPTHKASKKYDN